LSNAGHGREGAGGKTDEQEKMFHGDGGDFFEDMLWK
jgi:hypothetical protein